MIGLSFSFFSITCFLPYSFSAIGNFYLFLIFHVFCVYMYTVCYSLASVFKSCMFKKKNRKCFVNFQLNLPGNVFPIWWYRPKHIFSDWLKHYAFSNRKIGHPTIECLVVRFPDTNSHCFFSHTLRLNLNTQIVF